MNAFIRKQNPTPELRRPHGLSHSGVIAYDIIISLLMKYRIFPISGSGEVFLLPLHNFPNVSGYIHLNLNKFNQKDAYNIVGNTIFKDDLDAWLAKHNLVTQFDSFHHSLGVYPDVPVGSSTIDDYQEYDTRDADEDDDRLTDGEISKIIDRYKMEGLDLNDILYDLNIKGKRSIYYSKTHKEKLIEEIDGDKPLKDRYNEDDEFVDQWDKWSRGSDDD